MTPISLTRALLGSAAISLAALSPALAQTEITFFYPDRKSVV